MHRTIENTQSIKNFRSAVERFFLSQFFSQTRQATHEDCLKSARSFGLILPVGMRKKSVSESLRMHGLRKWWKKWKIVLHMCSTMTVSTVDVTITTSLCTTHKPKYPHTKYSDMLIVTIKKGFHLRKHIQFHLKSRPRRIKEKSNFVFSQFRSVRARVPHTHTSCGLSWPIETLIRLKRKQMPFDNIFINLSLCKHKNYYRLNKYG